MKSRIVLSLVAVLFVSLLPGCGDQGAGAAGGGSGAFPVSIPNVYGTTVVKKQPKRVVSIGYQEHDILLGLDIVPIALKQFHPAFRDGVGPWAKGRLGGKKPKVFPATSTEINIGQIAKLKPDLIVGTHAAVTKTQYQTMSELAPTLVRPKKYNNFAVPYTVQTKEIGKAVGKDKAAAGLIAHARASFTKARKAHPEFEGKRAVIVLPNPQTGGVYAFASTDPRGQFLENLGFTLPKAVDRAAHGQFSADLSPEQLELIGDVDLLVIVENQDPMPKYAKSKLLDDLDVAERGNSMRVHLGLSLAVSYNTVLSIPYTVDRLTPRMAKTLNA